MRTAGVIVVGAAVSLAGVLLGAWWAPFPVGLVVGLVVPRTRTALFSGSLSGLLAWSLPLLAAQLQYGLGPTARGLAAIMGFAGLTVIPVALTHLVGLLLGLTGAWLGSALPSFAKRAGAREGDVATR